MDESEERLGSESMLEMNNEFATSRRCLGGPMLHIEEQV